MNLIIAHRAEDFGKNDGNNFLRFAFVCNPVASVVVKGFSEYSVLNRRKVSALKPIIGRKISGTCLAIPDEWSVSPEADKSQDNIIFYNGQISIPQGIIGSIERKKDSINWFVISNGRFFTRTGGKIIKRVLENTDAELIAINADPELLSEREKVRMTAQGDVAGFRRLYSDSAEYCSVPYDWPAHLFIKTGVLNTILDKNSLSLSFSDIINKCRGSDLRVRAANVGGIMFDLENEDGLMQFCRMMLKEQNVSNENSAKSRDYKMIGKVLLGENVQIGSKTTIIGPTIIGDDVIVEEGSMISSSIIGSNIYIHRDQALHNRIKTDQPEQKTKSFNYFESDCSNLLKGEEKRFRKWPVISYARLFKRIADILAAMIVLILFFPLIPFIAAAIKLTSPGPVFYGDKRQGLHGKEFNCLKFRTMIAGADKIQNKLRFVSQVDGPQFKIDDDPRISSVGKFLRETYIDEIPQFFNVLFGQMSVVGPRPSPESENILCPFWRDARLSVKPGITGLWQICRTRRPMKDFQEWISYDIEYVKNLSPKMDLKICWRTAKKLVEDFIRQF
jgi:lipopolysaccharide/colanic/teichoic acid biosynthesis glycosyltransferase